MQPKAITLSQEPKGIVMEWDDGHKGVYPFPYLRKACKSKNYDSREYPHYNLARIYMQKGMLLRAGKELDAALKKNPNFGPARDLRQRVELHIN